MAPFQKFLFVFSFAVWQVALPTSARALSGTLLVNGKRSIKVLPGQSVTYTWNLPGVTTATSYYKMNKPDTCAGGGEGVRKGPLPWIATTGQGNRTTSVEKCQGGISYRIYIEGKNADGKTVKASGRVRVLSPIFLANGVKRLKVKPGDTVNYVWFATEGSSPSSYAVANKTDKCGSNKGEKKPWIATTIDGNQSATIESCQSGVSYKIYFQYTDSRGRRKKLSIQVSVL